LCIASFMKDFNEPVNPLFQVMPAFCRKDAYVFLLTSDI